MPVSLDAKHTLQLMDSAHGEFGIWMEDGEGCAWERVECKGNLAMMFVCGLGIGDGKV